MKANRVLSVLTLLAVAACASGGRSASPTVATSVATTATTGRATTAGPATTSTDVTTVASTTVASTTAASTTAAPPTSTVSTARAAGALPADLRARSLTFVSPAQGWVAGWSCAPAPCRIVLGSTADGGRSWARLIGPAPEVTWEGQDTSANELTVRFADADDGWLVTSTQAVDRVEQRLFATHDGGGHWRDVVLPAGRQPTDAIEASAGMVHLVTTGTDGTRVASSPVGADAWAIDSPVVPYGAGPVPSATLTLQRSAGWVLEVNRTVIAGLRLSGGRWIPWTPPCVDALGPAELAAADASHVVALCHEGVWGDVQRARLHTSTDGGLHFSAGPDLPAVFQGSRGLALSPAGVLVVALPHQNDAGADLAVSRDQGTTWTTSPAPGPGRCCSYLAFTTAQQAVAIDDDGHAWISRDAAVSWSGIPFTTTSP